MNYTIISRGDEDSERIKNELEEELEKVGLYPDQFHPDLVISVGGDGTILEAIHRYIHRLKDTAFVGVHTGHLGFYADWQANELEQLLHSITHLPLQTVDYPLLEVVLELKHEPAQRFLAINECTIRSTEGSMVMSMEINNDQFETFRGDGVCVSTPSGSTAYNKSLGGAIIHPSLSTMQITEMASINNRVFRTIGSPLILPAHHTCILKPLMDAFQVTIDHFPPIHKEISQITLNVADERVNFARFRSFPFWRRVRDSFVD